MVLVSLSETNIPSSGSIRLVLDIHAPEGTEVFFPEIETGIAPFTVADIYTEPRQTLPSGKRLHRRVWTLHPSLPGKTIFQPMEIRVGSGSIKTDPIIVFATSLLPADATDMLEIRDITDPIALLPEQTGKRRLWKFLLAAALAVAFSITAISRIRKPQKIATLPPHEAAFLALDDLPEEPVARIHELNRILLAYIEARFEISLSGKTLEETLPLLENNASLLDSRIIPLLETCETVRFSNRVPEGFLEEAEQTLRAYIEASREVPCD